MKWYEKYFATLFFVYVLGLVSLFLIFLLVNSEKYQVEFWIHFSLFFLNTLFCYRVAQGWERRIRVYEFHLNRFKNKGFTIEDFDGRVRQPCIIFQTIFLLSRFNKLAFLPCILKRNIFLRSSKEFHEDEELANIINFGGEIDDEMLSKLKEMSVLR